MYLPKASYMDKQPDITHNMRQILVDWLVEVSEEYKLQTETLYLAVNFIDRFLSLMSVQRAKLQLVGTAAMFIASKFEEIYPPDVTEFVYITDDTYTKRQVLRMEHLVRHVPQRAHPDVRELPALLAEPDGGGLCGPGAAHGGPRRLARVGGREQRLPAGGHPGLPARPPPAARGRRGLPAAGHEGEVQAVQAPRRLRDRARAGGEEPLAQEGLGKHVSWTGNPFPGP